MSASVYPLHIGVAGPAEAPSGLRSGGDLVDRCRRGDASAWEEMVERYQRLVFGTALREGLDRDDAADVTQTVFEALLTSLDKIREGERISAWLLVVTRRKVWRLRTRRLHEQPVPDVDPGAEPAPPRTPHPIEDSDRVLDLHEALNRLSPRCRDLLTALYFDPSEPSYEQVARSLGRPVGSIGPSRARCLEHLRRILAEGTAP